MKLVKTRKTGPFLFKTYENEDYVLNIILEPNENPIIKAEPKEIIQCPILQYSFLDQMIYFDYKRTNYREDELIDLKSGYNKTKKMMDYIHTHLDELIKESDK